MTWLKAPESIGRFTWHQVIQHALAVGLFLLLALSAALAGASGPGWSAVHRMTGLLSAGYFAYHLLYLVGVGVRHDVPLERVAFLPSAAEWRSLRGRPGAADDAGKYAPSEKGDYLAILAWTLLLVATGIALRWPGRLGVPGTGWYGWLRVLHAGCGSALGVHLLLIHVPSRWLDAPAALRRSILTGKVPLATAEGRGGWISELVSAGILVPAPHEDAPEAHPESRQVRSLLEEGNRLAAEGRFGEAAAIFEEALRLFPDYSQARFNLAVARMKEGRDDLAAAQFRLFVEQDPFNPMAERARELLGRLSGERGGGAL